MAKRKVVIVGTGQVGASLAFALMMRGTATHILLTDKNRDLAAGHCMDLNHGRLFVPPAKIETADEAEVEQLQKSAGGLQAVRDELHL